MRVDHYGPDVRFPGGMATVLQVVKSESVGADDVRVVPTWRPGNQVINLALLAKAAVSIARSSHSTIAHFHLSERGSFVREGSLVAYAALMGRSTVVTLHGADFDAFAERHPRLVSMVLRRARVVSVLSTRMQTTVLRLAPGARVEALGNPIPLPAAVRPPSESPKTVLFAGEIGTRKGVDTLIAAWERVAASVRDAKLIVVGPPGDLEIRSDVSLGLDVRTAMTPEEVRALLLEVRAAVLPSRAEAMPMFLLEAMAAGRPIVGTPVGNVGELAAAGGQLVGVDDAEALASVLETLLTEPGLADVMGEAGREWVSANRGASHISARWRSIYSQLGN